MTMRAAATRLIAIDPQTGLYHRAVMVGEFGPYALEGCEVDSLRKAQLPQDCSKRLLHECLFWRDEVTV
jgi:hypothetical protein